jgi:hypothetical protein
MNKKLRTSLVGFSALALVLAGTLYAPSQAAKKLPSNIKHTIQLDASSKSKLNATQVASFRKKIVNASHLTKVDCVILHAESMSSGNLAKVTRAAQTACQSARKANPNLKLEDISFRGSSRIKGTKFNLELKVYAARTVSFKKALGINTPLPKKSKILKFNAKYELPDGPSTFVAGGSFVGWNTQADGRGVDYQAGQTIRVKHAIQLHPKYVGHTINFNIVSLDTNFGSNYQLLYYAPGDNNYQRPVFSTSQPAFVTSDVNVMILYVPGAVFNTSGFTLTDGMSVTLTGANGGSCPDISSVDTQCTEFTITYLFSGTVTFDYQNSIQ